MKYVYWLILTVIVFIIVRGLWAFAWSVAVNIVMFIMSIGIAGVLLIGFALTKRRRNRP